MRHRIETGRMSEEGRPLPCHKHRMSPEGKVPINGDLAESSV
jgi:hypothetical protein